MNVVQLTLLTAAAIAAAAFVAVWVATSAAHPDRRRPTLAELAIGAVTDFFDVLGVGSFATSTSCFRLLRLVPDELIPGTANVGHGPAALAEALIFVSIVTVDPMLLACMTAAAGVGAWAGASLIIRLPRSLLRGVLGVGMLIAGRCSSPSICTGCPAGATRSRSRAGGCSRPSASTACLVR